MNINFISIYLYCQQNNYINYKISHILLIILNKLINYFCKIIT